MKLNVRRHELANAIDRVKQDIQKRLTELEAERDQLLKALDALTGGSSPVRRRGRPPRSGSASGNGRRRSGRRAPRGQRREQVLAVLEEAGGVGRPQVGSIRSQITPRVVGAPIVFRSGGPLPRSPRAPSRQ